MRISLRYQMLALMGAVLIGALVLHVSLASALFTSDRLAYLFDFSGRLAGTLSEEIRIHLSSQLEKLAYFGARQAEGDSGEALFATDEELLGLEVWQRQPDGSFARTFESVRAEKLERLGQTEADLRRARVETAVPLEQVVGRGALLLNGSLPPDLALVRLATSLGGGERVVVADLSPTRLLRIFSRPKLSDAYLVGDGGQVIIHPDPKTMLSRADRASHPIVRRALASAVQSGVHEYQLGGRDRLGAYASLDLAGLTVVIEVDKAEALRANTELSRRSLLFAVLALSVAMLLSVYFARRLTAPLHELEEKMEVISRGEFGVEVPERGSNELANLAAAFNRMSRELSRREALLQEASAQLVQSEKLSALGEMSAGLAHEVKNPMVGIVGFSELGEGAQSIAEAREYFGLIRSDARRANEILQNLLEFARPEKVEFSPLDPNEVVRGAVRLVAHQVTMTGAKLSTRYQDALPKIRGNDNQLRQVLVNLMMNALQAMQGAPEKIISVSTRRLEEGVAIEVKDTGAGMSEEVRRKIFRPFFSTKPRGQGTGLGLSVSRSIVLQHQGDLTVDSEPGKGALFRILLPADLATPAAAKAPFAEL